MVKYNFSLNDLCIIEKVTVESLNYVTNRSHIDLANWFCRNLEISYKVLVKFTLIGGTNLLGG